MEFRGQQTVIIDLLRTRELARLRDIKQLGLAHFVYPSAEHSRFSHALGAAHLAIRFGEHLREVGRGYLPELIVPDDDSIRDMALAALCHDIGHGPFSHAWERDVLTKHFDRAPWIDALGLSDRSQQLSNAPWHELVTLGFLLSEESELHLTLERLEPGTADRIAAILSGEFWPPYAKQLVGSDVDLDRSDYLVRDSVMTGLVYGKVDLSRLIDCSYIAETDSGELILAFEEWRGRSAISDFLQARAALHESVYFHKTIRAAEALMGQLMRRLSDTLIAQVYGRNVGPLSRQVLDILTCSSIHPRALMHLHDRSVWTLVEEVALLPEYDLTAQDLARRLLSRELLHLVDVDAASLRTALRHRDFHDSIQSAIGPFVRGDPTFFYVVDESQTVTIAGRELGGYFLTRDGRVISFADDVRLRTSIPPDVSIQERLFVPREAVQATRAVLQQLI